MYLIQDVDIGWKVLELDHIIIFKIIKEIKEC